MNSFVFDRRFGARLAICICLLIPLVLAIVFYVTTDTEDYAIKNTIALTVTDSRGGVNELTEQSDFDLYSKITEGATEVTKDFKFSKENPYTVCFTDSNKDKITYTLYMSANEAGKAEAVYIDAEGKCYLVDENVAQQLIKRPEFSDLNNLQIIPVATFKGLGEGIVIEPTQCNWTYRAFDGNLKKITKKNTPSDKTVFFNPEDEGSIVISFDNTPDSIKLRILKGNEPIFDDDYSKLADVENTVLKYSNDTPLSLEVEAVWNESYVEKRNFCGTITYNADLFYDVAPEYYSVDFAKGGIPGGDFTVVRIKNFNDGDTLTMKNELGIDEKVIVYDYAPYEGVPGTKPEFNKLVFIPCKAGIKADTYTLDFTTGTGRTGTAKVKIKSADDYS